MASPAKNYEICVNYIGEFVEDASNFKPVPRPRNKSDVQQAREEKPKSHKHNGKKPKKQKGS